MRTLLVIVLASLATTSLGGGNKAKTKHSSEGVSKYTNELYMGGTDSDPNRGQVGVARDGADYDDYNADFDSFLQGFRKQPSLHYQETREVHVKQGRLKGIVRGMHPQSGLKNVDQFLGIPYAEAPIERLRFMPPGAPVPWSGLKMATKFAPVCPQNLPDINNPANTMSKGRYDQIKRLLPYLKHESEDCLYLNLYVPSWDGPQLHTKYPVVVFIHGESYEWNSGNPYDGSILASYGQVIVVTLNFRLGILGFLKPGVGQHTVSNFGLFDQIAALQWIKENIESFGGDPKSVTLMGHGYGAASINFLMVSPIAKGLFHRAILMSGSALSDWALANDVIQTTLKVAQDLNCPLVDESEELLKCLRNKSLSELMSVKVPASEFSTRFGPIVDGLVVPSAVHKVMGQFGDIFSRYDLMYGVTELESYHSLNAVSLTYGILANERDTILKTYIQNRFEKRPDLALAATLKEYTDLYMDSSNKGLAEEHRDTLLEILSDARVTAPLVQTGLFSSRSNPNCYMYVFSHNSEAGEYARISQSVIGEELPYVFGAPLGHVGPFQPHYNQQERLFSEAIMKYWSNFAKTGNPKTPWKDAFLNSNPQDWRFYNVDWPPFNPINQTYLHLGITPILSHRYRYKYMRFWNQELPSELDKQPFLLPAKTPPPVLEFAVTKPPVRKTSSSSLDIIQGRMNMYPKSRYEDPIDILKQKLQTLPSQGMQGIQEPSGMVEVPGVAPPKFELSPDPSSPDNILQSESTLTLLIGIVLLFLIFNVFVIIGYVVRRNMTKRKLSHKYEDNIFDAMTDDKRSKYNETNDSYIMDIVRQNGTNTYEAIKATRLPGSKAFILTRQLSSSTVDAHTKVTDWISQDMTNYSSLESKLNNDKVNVAIDATPAGRGESVSRQEPIEVTKAKLDYGFAKDIIICQEVDMDPVLDSAPIRFDGEYQRSNSISEDPPLLFYPNPNLHEEVTSFIEPSLDINVTSRDSVEREPLSPEEALRGIQRRNFPKVLPDYPENVEENLPASYKRRSLPPQYFMMHAPYLSRLPPAPPPRISSTLERRRRPPNTSTFLSSSLKIADEPPSPPDEPIAVTELQVGSLALTKHPHSNEPIYLSMRRMNSIQENSTPCRSLEDPDEAEYENKEVPDPEDDAGAKVVRGSSLVRQMSSTSDESESSTGTVKELTKQSEA